MSDDPGAAGAADFLRAVGTAGIHHDHFIGKCRAFQQGRNPVRLIQGDDNDTDHGVKDIRFWMNLSNAIVLSRDMRIPITTHSMGN